MALPPMNTTEDVFVREVDEELRRDELVSVWQRWGRWIVLALVATLVAFGGWLFWQDRQAKAAGIEGERYDKALEQATDGDEAGAAKSMAELKKDSGVGYRASAEMTEAALALSKKDTKGAIAIYSRMAGDESLPQPWRDIALVRQTAIEFDDIKPEIVIARLKPLAIKGNPWFGSAGEMTAISYLKQGKRDLAGKVFADIAKDEMVPESIRSRAIKMAGVLGMDVVDATSEIKAQ